LILQKQLISPITADNVSKENKIPRCNTRWDTTTHSTTGKQNLSINKLKSSYFAAYNIRFREKQRSQQISIK
jgi:hypothetical protein